MFAHSCPLFAALIVALTYFESRLSASVINKQTVALFCGLLYTVNTVL